MFWVKIVKIDKKSYKDIGIYSTRYITIKRIDDCKNIHSVNPLLKTYNDVWDGIRDKIKEVSSGECDYEKDYMKIKFNSDDDSLLNKPLKFHLITITIKSVFEEDGKLYPEVFLDDTLYELKVQKC